MLIAKSCIKTSPKPFVINEEYDWVFFSSKASVEAFFNQEKHQANKKYAAIGKATANELRKHISAIHFIGEGETTNVAQQFKKALKVNEHVLFPISNLALQTVQKQLPNRQAINVLAYETLDVDNKNIEADTYIFTSPSNVKSFLKNNVISSNSKVIAIGYTTKAELEKKGIENVVVAFNYSELAILDCI